MYADKIELNGMVFYGFHGTNPAEKELGQRFVVDLEVEKDLSQSGLSDDLNDTVSYSEIYGLVKQIIEGSSHNLLESLAGDIATRVLGRFEVDLVRVAMKKPEVPIKGSVLAYVGVEICRRR